MWGRTVPRKPTQADLIRKTERSKKPTTYGCLRCGWTHTFDWPFHSYTCFHCFPPDRPGLGWEPMVTADEIEKLKELSE